MSVFKITEIPKSNKQTKKYINNVLLLGETKQIKPKGNTQ